MVRTVTDRTCSSGLPGLSIRKNPPVGRSHQPQRRLAVDFITRTSCDLISFALPGFVKKRVTSAYGGPEEEDAPSPIDNALRGGLKR